MHCSVISVLFMYPMWKTGSHSLMYPACQNQHHQADTVYRMYVSQNNFLGHIQPTYFNYMHREIRGNHTSLEESSSPKWPVQSASF
jgi:hypothetical protein